VTPEPPLSDTDLLVIEADLKHIGEDVLLHSQAVVHVEFARRLARHARRLLAELRRLRCGELTPEEFQALCHHLDGRPGCTREAFEAGCAAYQEKLFGPKPGQGL
jgi:hypothetical protein